MRMKSVRTGCCVTSLCSSWCETMEDCEIPLTRRPRWGRPTGRRAALFSWHLLEVHAYSREKLRWDKKKKYYSSLRKTQNEICPLLFFHPAVPLGLSAQFSQSHRVTNAHLKVWDRTQEGSCKTLIVSRVKFFLLAVPRCTWQGGYWLPVPARRLVQTNLLLLSKESANGRLDAFFLLPANRSKNHYNENNN